MSDLVCKWCWIEVVPLREPMRVIGRGGDTYLYKHKTPRTETGENYCGRPNLKESDVEFAKPVDEDAFKKAISDESEI